MMMMRVKKGSRLLFLLWLLININIGFFIISCCFLLTCSSAIEQQQQLLPDDEVDALREIANTLGKKDWDFTVNNPCDGKSGWATLPPIKSKENAVTCNCSFFNNTVCHVTSIVLKSQNLSGVLPPELVKLPYLQEIDLTRNYLNGTIPKEWSSLQLVKIALGANRLHGPIPKEIGNITTLRNLTLDDNQLSGFPPELGDIVGIEQITISSNSFKGELPKELSKLINLKDFRISGNQFNGKIPNFIQKWRMLQRLEIQGSGFEGPIPSGISLLEHLKDLRISDLNGIGAASFPPLSNMTNMKTLILRSCNIVGSIPYYLGQLTKIKTLDLSFNKLIGEIPSNFGGLSDARLMYLTGNFLNGTNLDWIPKKVTYVDLSYNNFKLGSSGQHNCNENNINLFGSSSLLNNSSGITPCLKNPSCQPKRYSFHINCGGNEIRIGNTTYNEDQDYGGSNFYLSQKNDWALSSTGTFMDNDNDIDNNYYKISNTSMLSMDNGAQLYMTARLSPLSLTYYGFCLVNGNYTVKLHFAEIMFTNDETYRSLGRRIFDVYIQGKRVIKDFDIVEAANGVRKEVIRNFTAVVVSNGSLEIRFFWAGKGTTTIPVRGTYGPLVSAISVDSNFSPLDEDKKKISAMAGVGIVASVLFLIFIILGVLWWKGCLTRKFDIDQELRGLDLNTGSFTLRQIKAATNNFAAENKIGEGGFGPVYKGVLSDSTIIAVKQLSSKSKQGNREFVNEIGLISAVQHPNLVRLYGCCIEGNQLLLIYEYMENNSLARALFGKEEESQLKLDWPTRHKICVGIARGLVYLHEESRLKIVHRDIKATNVLLDKDLNPKISDFGLAKLDEEDDTHISTRIAGTFGYMAPEYAMRGYLTDKADVYSFGVVALEIVSGKTNTKRRPKQESVYLLDLALVLKEEGSLMKLVDPELGSNFNEEEALGMINLALICTNASPTLRPKMSEVLSMLGGRTVVQGYVSNPSKTPQDNFKQNHDQSLAYSQTHSISTDAPWTESSTSGNDLYPFLLDSEYCNKRVEEEITN